MRYSNFTIEQIASPIYQEVAQKLLKLAKDEDTKSKMHSILYEGGFDNFSVNGSLHMEKEVQYKNNPVEEAKKRLNMAYLLLTNPKIIEVMKKSNGYFLHGTNANALPSILKYGINSAETSIQNNIDVNTGEETIRNNGKRNFVSITDCLDVALLYANIKPNEKDSIKELLNFGVVIGTSLEDMSGLNVTQVISDTSEVGVKGNLPLEHIKFLAVPDDKVEFVKKIIGENDIEVVSMDMKDPFFNSCTADKSKLLEHDKGDIQSSNTQYPTYFEDDVKPVVNKRRISNIKGIFNTLKTKIRTSIEQMHNKNVNERG